MTIGIGSFRSGDPIAALAGFGHGVRRHAGRERLEATNARIVPATRDAGIVGYALFTNETSSPVTLVGLESPAFERVEMRETLVARDVPVTRPVERLTLLPGDGVEFAPGGRCLSMTGPRWPLATGSLIGVTLRFSSGRTRVVPFRIVADEPPRGRRAG